MRYALILMTALFAPAASAEKVAPPGTAEAHASYVAKTNESYAQTPYAVLKLDDAIYAKAGETVFVHAGTGGALKLSKDAATSLLSVTYTGTVFEIAGSANAPETVPVSETKRIELSATTRLRIQEVEIAPGEKGMRVGAYNDANPEAAAFAGVAFFPFAPDFVVTAKVEPRVKPEPVIFQTSRGWYKKFWPVADAVFTLKGQEFRLPLYAGTGDAQEIDSLSAFFTDANTGHNVYGTGRYMDWSFEKGALPPTLLVNFNEAYNPLCARSPHWNCPVAIDALAIPVDAGELAPAKKDHAAAQ